MFLKKFNGEYPESMGEVAECVIEHLRKTSTVVGFAWNMIKSENVSNSHHCPHNGVRNWARRDAGLPNGYPGWTGRVWVRYGETPKMFGSDPFRGSRTFPGTGGFGDYGGPWKSINHISFLTRINKIKTKYDVIAYSWDYIFYDADWPGLAKSQEEDKAWDILKGVKRKVTHQFRYIDSEVERMDDEFIKKYTNLEEESAS